jgi:hypothetical protein
MFVGVTNLKKGWPFVLSFLASAAQGLNPAPISGLRGSESRQQTLIADFRRLMANLKNIEY